MRWFGSYQLSRVYDFPLTEPRRLPTRGTVSGDTPMLRLKDFEFTCRRFGLICKLRYGETLRRRGTRDGATRGEIMLVREPSKTQMEWLVTRRAERT